MLTCSSVRIECRGRVKGVPGAVFESFETYEEADRVYRGAIQRGEVEVVQQNSGAASASAKRTKHQTSHWDEFDIGLDGGLFRSSQWKSCFYAGAVQSPNSLSDDMSLLHSPSRTLPPSPPTGVTQYVELEDSPLLHQPRGLSPRVTVEDTSYTASPLLPTFRPAQIRRVQVTPTLSTMTVKKASSPRALRRQETAPASFEAGARYPTVEEVRKGQGLDPRVMLPPQRIFDPANVKSRPRASSITSARRERPDNGQINAESTSPDDATRRLIPGCLPVHCLEDDEISSLPPRWLADKGKSRVLADDVLPAFGRVPSNKRYSLSEYSHHIQEVYTADRPEHCNYVIVRCPLGNSCCHGPCGGTSASATVRSDGTRPRSHYVDAEVSPILPSVSSARETSPRKANAREPVARVSDASSGQGVHSFLGLSHSPQVPYRSHVVESDVRSPFTRGTRVPSGLSE